jgi:thiamine biosynthesis lipoprotein
MSTIRPAPVAGKSEVRALGTTAEVLLTDVASLARGTVLLRGELERVDRLASRFRPDSELSRLNASEDRPVQVSKGLAELIEVSLRAARLSGGAVDPTIEGSMNRIGYDCDFAAMSKDQPERRPAAQPAPGWQSVRWEAGSRTVTLPRGVTLDVGATAKAACADRAAAVIAGRVGCGVLVSIGGDLSIAGLAPAGGWSVGLSDVSGSAADQVRQVVALESGGLATSGSAARSWTREGRAVHHLIDPATGLPADSPWRTVAVAAVSCVDANVAATAAVIKGSDAPRWLTALGLPAVLVSTTGEVVRTEGWPSSEDG